MVVKAEIINNLLEKNNKNYMIVSSVYVQNAGFLSADWYASF
jgi:hypothetical protein